MSQHYSIALDGPSGAGKSTIAKTIARDMNYLYLDTGAMYRSFGLYAIRNGIDFTSGIQSPERDRATRELLSRFNLDIRYEQGEQKVVVNGEDYTGLIRTPEVSLAASKVAVLPAVRKRMVELQRNIASRSNVVMDGRDIGTYVLPNAQIKIFITASSVARAKRRFQELQAKGMKNITFEQVHSDMQFRDRNDSSRAFAPLSRANDAALLDTTNLSLQESIEAVRRFIMRKLNLSEGNF